MDGVPGPRSVGAGLARSGWPRGGQRRKRVRNSDRSEAPAHYATRDGYGAAREAIERSAIKRYCMS